MEGQKEWRVFGLLEFRTEGEFGVVFFSLLAHSFSFGAERGFIYEKDTPAILKMVTNVIVQIKISLLA